MDGKRREEEGTMDPSAKAPLPKGIKPAKVRKKLKCKPFPSALTEEGNTL